MSNFSHVDVKIIDFITSIKSGKYQLPCFQRDFKWTPSKIKSLINSIQHSYPVGSLLFLKVSQDNLLIPAQPFKYADKKSFTERPEILVLDGQQRMTSCFSVFTNTGPYTYYINLEKLMKQHEEGISDVDFETIIEHKKHKDVLLGEMEKGLFPMSFLVDRQQMRKEIKRYGEVIAKDLGKSKLAEFVKWNFENYIDSILDYAFPAIVLSEKTTMEAVCKVFQTINTTGLKLSIFDICLAVFIAQDINLKEKVNQAKDSHPYLKILLEKEPTIVLQIIALLANKIAGANSLAKVLECCDIENYWNDAIDGIEQTVLLLDSFGAGTKKNLDLLPYTPIVPIIAAVLAKTKYIKKISVPKKANIEKKLKVYFYTVALSARYTEGTNAKINDDFKALMRWIEQEETPLIIEHGVEWNTNIVIVNKKNGAFGKAVLCLLNNKGLKDFYTSNSVGIGENLVACDLHHIFPKAEYGDRYPKVINSVFNFTWLTKESNVHIQDGKTCHYIKDIMKDVPLTENQLKGRLDNHFINDELLEFMRQENYIEFIKGRAELFKRAFMEVGVKFTDVSQDEMDGDFDDEDDE